MFSIKMFYSPFALISLPLITSISLALFVYETREGYFYKNFLLFSSLFLITIAMEFFFRFKRIKINLNPESFIKNNFYESRTALLFGFFLTFFCAMDLFIRGPLLFVNPLAYDDFTPLELCIRYVTIMCWTLIPIGFFCTNNKKITYIFILTAIVFPLISVDRNRFLTSMYSMLVCINIKKNISHDYKNIITKNWLKSFFILALITSSSALIFTFIGDKRSPINLVIAKKESDKSYTRNTHLKERFENFKNINDKYRERFILKDYIYKMPSLNQWVLVYATIGVYNLAALQNIDYRDPDYLNHQFFKGLGSNISYKALTPKPIPHPPLSACTEFFPFFLYGGNLLVIFSFFALSFIYVAYVSFYSKHSSSIFLLLGFLKMTFCCLFLGFGTQFFRYSHLLFLVMMLFMHWIASQLFTQQIIDKLYNLRKQ